MTQQRMRNDVPIADIMEEGYFAVVELTAPVSVILTDDLSEIVEHKFSDYVNLTVRSLDDDGDKPVTVSLDVHQLRGLVAMANAGIDHLTATTVEALP